MPAYRCVLNGLSRGRDQDATGRLARGADIAPSVLKAELGRNVSVYLAALTVTLTAISLRKT